MTRALLAALLSAALLAACAPQSPRAAATAAPASAPASPPAPAEPPAVSAALAGFTEAALLADVAWLADPALAGRSSEDAGGRAAAERVAEELRDAGLAVTLQEIPGVPGAVNVIGVLAGSDEAVLVCAHHDHLGTRGGVLYPGADDNASGTAVLLALARALGRTHRGRTVVLVSTGAEELGLLGARAYVARPAFPLEKTRAVLNFDMVGRKFFETAGGLDNTIAVVGLEADAELAAAVRAGALAERVDLVMVAAGAMRLIGAAERSDDAPFRERGLPTAFFSTSLSPDYHEPSDTPEHLRPAQLVRAARVAARAVVALGGLSLSAPGAR